MSPPTHITVVQNQLVELYVQVDASQGALKQVEFFYSSDGGGPDISLGSSTAARDKAEWYPRRRPETSTSKPSPPTSTARRPSPATRSSSPPASVTDAGPQVSLLGSLDGRQISIGAPVTLVASAVDSSGNPLASVQFYADGQPIGGLVTPSRFAGPRTDGRRPEASLLSPTALAQITTKLSQALQVITAVGTDRNGVSAVSPGKQVFAKTSSSDTVRCAITSPATNATLPANSSNQSVAVTPDNTGGSISRVELFVNDRSVGAMTSAPFNFTLPPLATGTYALTAIVSDDAAGLNGVSDPAIINVAASLPTVDLALGGNGIVMEAGGKGTVIVSRTGDTSAPLAVLYKVKGSARPGVDYKALSGKITIPAGASQAKIKIKPINGSPNSGTLKIRVVLLPSADGSYQVGATPVKVRLIGN